MQRREAPASLDEFADTWDEVCELLTVGYRTRRLLARYPLRAADTGQRGAATLVRDQISGTSVFLSLDCRQSEAAKL